MLRSLQNHIKKATADERHAFLIDFIEYGGFLRLLDLLDCGVTETDDLPDEAILLTLDAIQCLSAKAVPPPSSSAAWPSLAPSSSATSATIDLAAEVADYLHNLGATQTLCRVLSCSSLVLTSSSHRVMTLALHLLQELALFHRDISTQACTESHGGDCTFRIELAAAVPPLLAAITTLRSKQQQADEFRLAVTTLGAVIATSPLSAQCLTSTGAAGDVISAIARHPSCREYSFLVDATACLAESAAHASLAFAVLTAPGGLAILRRGLKAELSAQPLAPAGPLACAVTRVVQALASHSALAVTCVQKMTSAKVVIMLVLSLQSAGFNDRVIESLLMAAEALVRCSEAGQREFEREGGLAAVKGALARVSLDFPLNGYPTLLRLTLPPTPPSTAVASAPASHASQLPTSAHKSGNRNL